jgi:hypothetical protein
MLFIVPSRGRPHKAAAIIQYVSETRESTHLTIAVDHDDPTLEEYRQAVYANKHPWATLSVFRSNSMVSSLNAAARHFAAMHMHIGFMGDDHHPMTPSFDTRLAGAIDGMGGGIAYANDMFQGVNLPTQVVISSKIINCLGFMAPPSLTHLYVDNYWRALGEGIGRFSYCPDVVIRHDHPQAGLTEWDDGYIRVNGGEMYAKDEAAFNAIDIQTHITRVRKLFGGS